MMGKDFLPSLALDRVLYEHTQAARVSPLSSRGGDGAREPICSISRSFSLVQSLASVP